MQEPENYADELDRASVLQDQMNEQALAVVQANNKPETHPDFDGISCIECADELPPIRLKLRKVRCVTCQTILEAKRRMMGG